MKRVLITGAGSYVGGWARHRLEREPERFYVEELDVRSDTWRAFDFSNWDAVYHVAGIAHVRESTLSKGDYMSANRDLAVEVGKRARAAGVRQLLFMSTAAVYAASDAVHGVTPSTVPAPETWYGESKLEAEEGLFALECSGFRVAILRCPMIYGPGCRGNFPRLVSIARNLPVFPRVSNRRSALHVDNIAEFVAIAIDRELGGIFWPQDGEYMDTARAVSVLRAAMGGRTLLVPFLTPAVRLASRYVGAASKAFGDFWFDMEACSSSVDSEYRVVSLEEDAERCVLGMDGKR